MHTFSFTGTAQSQSQLVNLLGPLDVDRVASVTTFQEQLQSVLLLICGFAGKDTVTTLLVWAELLQRKGNRWAFLYLELCEHAQFASVSSISLGQHEDDT